MYVFLEETVQKQDAKMTAGYSQSYLISDTKQGLVSTGNTSCCHFFNGCGTGGRTGHLLIRKLVVQSLAALACILKYP